MKKCDDKQFFDSNKWQLNAVFRCLLNEPKITVYSRSRLSLMRGQKQSIRVSTVCLFSTFKRRTTSTAAAKWVNPESADTDGTDPPNAVVHSERDDDQRQKAVHVHTVRHRPEPDQVPADGTAASAQREHGGRHESTQAVPSRTSEYLSRLVSRHQKPNHFFVAK